MCCGIAAHSKPLQMWCVLPESISCRTIFHNHSQECRVLHAAGAMSMCLIDKLLLGKRWEQRQQIAATAAAGVWQLPSHVATGQGLQP